MAEIVNLGNYRTQEAEKRAFAPWRKRFKQDFPTNTRLVHLSNKTLLFLAAPGEESAFAFYELIMGALDLGAATKFSYMENKNQIRVTDIHFFLVDQCRFEMMRRLGWVNPPPLGHHAIVEMILDFDGIMSLPGQNAPELCADHPGYDQYLKLIDRDREGFIRGLLPKALEKFRQISQDTS